METILNFIGGEFLEPVSKTYFDDINPANGKVVAQIPESDADDVRLAVKAAEQAFEEWSNSSLEYRFKILNNIAELIEQQSDVLAHYESLDTGKPLWLSQKVDIARAASNFRFFATAAMHFASESHETPNTAINYTLRQPIGIVGCISPWNLPLYLFTWKICPALATGNCVIAKPSELSPLTAFHLAKICKEAGLPAGVLNILHGTGAKVGAAIVEHEKIKAISFTGGTKTGAMIAKEAAPKFKKLSLELGGKNPAIICADCDFENTLAESIRFAFSNQGQICLCGSRIFIERSIYEKFKLAFVEKTKKLKIGDPFHADTKVGAVISKAHQEKILSYIDLAKQEGGKILTGGHALQLEGDCSGGFFVEPTIIEGLAYNCRTNMEEIFGPVVSVIPFDTLEEAVMMANTSEYGLAASIWTQDIKKAHYLARQIQCGIIWINCWLLRDLRTPFGGMHNSGVGREGGWEAMRFFTEAKNVCIKY